MFDNISEFKLYSTPFLKDLDIKLVWTKIKNPPTNATVEWVHQVIWNMLVTNDLSNKCFDYIDPWGETLSYITFVIRAYYHKNIQATPDQTVFGRGILFNITSFIDWQVITAGKKWQVDIDNVQENARRFTHDYVVGNVVYVKMTVIYRKLYYKKQGPYRIKILYKCFS